MEQNNNNGLLYFMVGALLVAVFGLGYLYVSNDPSFEGDVSIVEPASDGDGGERSDFSFEVDDNGFTASAESESDSPN